MVLAAFPTVKGFIRIFDIVFICKFIDEIVETRSHALISVDGGINDITGKDCLNIGADVLVAGNYLFSADNFKERYDSLFH